jgi:hypothetical protein
VCFVKGRNLIFKYYRDVIRLITYKLTKLIKQFEFKEQQNKKMHSKAVHIFINVLS